MTTPTPVLELTASPFDVAGGATGHRLLPACPARPPPVAAVQPAAPASVVPAALPATRRWFTGRLSGGTGRPVGRAHGWLTPRQWRRWCRSARRWAGGPRSGHCSDSAGPDYHWRKRRAHSRSGPIGAGSDLPLRPAQGDDAGGARARSGWAKMALRRCWPSCRAPRRKPQVSAGARRRIIF